MNFKFKNKFLFISLLNFLSIFYLIGAENSEEFEKFRDIFFCKSFEVPEEDIKDSFNAFINIKDILLSEEIDNLSKNKKKI